MGLRAMAPAEMMRIILNLEEIRASLAERVTRVHQAAIRIQLITSEVVMVMALQ